jgi:hypothetical protein
VEIIRKQHETALKDRAAIMSNYRASQEKIAKLKEDLIFLERQAADK